jgi:hypothetical protein
MGKTETFVIAFGAIGLIVFLCYLAARRIDQEWQALLATVASRTGGSIGPHRSGAWDSLEFKVDGVTGLMERKTRGKAPGGWTEMVVTFRGLGQSVADFTLGTCPPNRTPADYAEYMSSMLETPFAVFGNMVGTCTPEVGQRLASVLAGEASAAKLEIAFEEGELRLVWETKPPSADELVAMVKTASEILRALSRSAFV